MSAGVIKLPQTSTRMTALASCAGAPKYAPTEQALMIAAALQKAAMAELEL